MVLDWERRGKGRRQAGADTQISTDIPEDLRRVRAATTGRVLCRVNGWGPQTVNEIDTAILLGADEVLLPMVRGTEEVDAAISVVAGRCQLGILVETSDAVQRIGELVLRPLSRIYVGLNDLMIDRGSTCLFTPLVDGTVDDVGQAAIAAHIPFGVAGLTRPEAGRPVPCRLLIAALARLGASFTFLRRSFHADVAGRDIPLEVPRILDAVALAHRRSSADLDADLRELHLFLQDARSESRAV